MRSIGVSMTSEQTPRSRVKGLLRQMFVSSRERSAALKATGYCCAKCGVKQSAKKGAVVKLDVHHKAGHIDWDKILDLIYKELLVPADELEPLCKECHYKETYGA